MVFLQSIANLLIIVAISLLYADFMRIKEVVVPGGIKGRSML